MSRGQEIAGSTAAGNAPPAAGDVLRDWQATRADASIQYTPLPPHKAPQTPEWLERVFKWLAELFEPLGKALGMSIEAILYGLLAVTVLLVLFLVWRLVIEPMLAARREALPQAEPEWQPDRAAALALLGDADRLAAEGRFGEAAHLLLQRSVHHIADSRPDWLHPASTAREITVLPSLPQRARAAFAVIAERVERSRYALRALDSQDWTAAREAYSDFALQELRTPA